ncbi:ATP-dependent DNA helicase PIF1-like protein [Tanacetum coccineum]
MKVVYYLTTQTPHSPHVANPHPKGVYSYYNPGIDDPKRHYGFKPGLLGKSVSLGVDISNWEMFEDDWRLESKEVSPLGEELSLFDRPNEVERGRILKAHRLEPILQQQNSQRMALSHHGGRKAHLLEDKQIPSVRVFDKHFEEIHMTWAHLEKKRTRLRTNTKTLEDLCLQSLETASPILHDAVTTHLVMASQHFMTASARTDSHVDLEDSTHDGQRNDQGTTLIRGGCLFQQYLVAYSAIEEQRLKWTPNNQDTLRVDLYHNVCDAVTRGDTNAAGLGKRIVLPGTFVGGPRYMMQNYQDVMALCCTYGNPDLFITFTSNPKWLEISEMLAYFPRQKAHDPPEGLPHAHILLWVEDHCKCKTAAQIDDIISVELPSPTDDPDSRRNNKASAKKSKFTFDNRHVVIHNHYLLLKYQAHVNMEWCNRSKAIKYLNKGPNRATVVIQENIQKGDNVTPKRPLKPWEETWQFLSEDILHRKRKLFRYPELQLSIEQIQNYCLVEIQELLNRNGRSLTDFQDLPWSNPQLLTNMDNHLIREALDFDMNKSKLEHETLHPLLNPEQRLIYEQVIESVHNQRGQFYFVYGPCGTGKTFLYNTIIARLRTEIKIVLAVASSAIAALLLPGVRTAHSRFIIPLELLENNTCGIK